jgi:hypothetical protein
MGIFYASFKMGSVTATHTEHKHFQGIYMKSFTWQDSLLPGGL